MPDLTMADVLDRSKRRLLTQGRKVASVHDDIQEISEDLDALIAHLKGGGDDVR